jgi:Ribonuclease G/E
VKILAAWSPGEIRVAAWQDGLVDYAIERPGAPDGVGDIHRARVIARVPAMAGAFVALADGEGFLPDSAGGAGVTAGQAIGVRVTRAAQGGKGGRLASSGEAVESGPPMLLRRGPGAVERLAALHEDAEIVVDHAGLAAALRPMLGARVRVGTAFDEAVEAAVDALAQPAADLPGGARMGVYPTPALTAIDVDLGAATAQRRDKAGSQLAANRALLPALATQIRLRGLAGAIVVDLAGMTPKRRGTLAADFAAALATDPLKPRFLGFSALGLAEILRPRVHPPLHELLAGPHAAGLAALRAAAREAMSRPAWRGALRAAPSVATALRRDEIARTAFAAHVGWAIPVREDHALAGNGWTIEEAGDG